MQVEMYNGLDLCLMTPELNHFEFFSPPLNPAILSFSPWSYSVQ